MGGSFLGIYNVLLLLTTDKFVSFLPNEDTALILRILMACGGEATSVSWKRNSPGFLPLYPVL